MRLLRYAIMVVALCFGATIPAHAGMNDKSPITTTSTGFGVKGFYKVIIETYHGIYRDAYPGTSATIKPSSMAGGLTAIAAGQADISYAAATVELKKALEGQAPFPGSLKGKLSFVMNVLPVSDSYYIANKKWADRNGIKSIADIGKKKPKFGLGINRKGLLYINEPADMLFKEYGFSLAHVEKWGGHITYNASGPTLKDLRDGKINVMIHNGFHPDGRIVDLNKARELVWIKSDRAVLAKIADQVGFKVVTMAKSTYSFLEEDVPTLRAALFAVAGPHVSDEHVYKIVKALGENMERVRAIHPSFRNHSVEVLAEKPANIPYHPGALKYYREKSVVN